MLHSALLTGRPGALSLLRPPSTSSSETTGRSPQTVMSAGARGRSTGSQQLAKLHRQRVEREKALLREPGTFDAIIDHIGNGGTLAQWCRVQDVRYTHIYGWIAADPQRAASFAAAMESRKQLLADDFLEDVQRYRTTDVRRFFDKKGLPIPPHELPDDLARVTKELEHETILDDKGKPKITSSKIKYIPQDKGTEMLGKHLGILSERHEVTGKNGGPVEFKDLTRNLSKLSDVELASLNGLLSKLGVGVPT